MDKNTAVEAVRTEVKATHGQGTMGVYNILIQLTIADLQAIIHEINHGVANSDRWRGVARRLSKSGTKHQLAMRAAGFRRFI